MMAKKNRRNKKDLLQNTDFGDLLENAIEGKDVLNNDPMEAKKLKYKKSMKGLSMQEWTKESLKYMLGAIDYDLYDNSVEWMKNMAKFHMRNGIYKAVVKEKQEDGYIITIGKIDLGLEEWWETKPETLDYFVENKKINNKLNIWDELNVDVNLNQTKTHLSIEELILDKWKYCSLRLDNLTEKWVTINIGEYKWFISRDKFSKDVNSKTVVFLKVSDVKIDNSGENIVSFDVVKRPKSWNKILRLIDVNNSYVGFDDNKYKNSLKKYGVEKKKNSKKDTKKVTDTTKKWIAKTMKTEKDVKKNKEDVLAA